MIHKYFNVGCDIYMLNVLKLFGLLDSLDMFFSFQCIGTIHLVSVHLQNGTDFELQDWNLLIEYSYSAIINGYSFNFSQTIV